MELTWAIWKLDLSRWSLEKRVQENVEVYFLFDEKK